MSNSFTNTRKKAVATALVCSVLALGGLGGTYAALTATISTEAETESLVNDLRYFYAWTETSAPIVASVTPVEAPQAQTFVKVIDNEASVASHFALWVSGVDIADVPDSILDNSFVSLTIDDGENDAITVNQLTLRQFLTSALVFMTDEWEPFVLAPRTDLVMTVSITAPTDDGDIDFSDVLDFESAGFVTNVTFNQVIGGTSDLMTYANLETTWGGDNVMGVPLNGGAFTF